MRYGEKALYGRFSFLEKNGDNGHYCCNEEGGGDATIAMWWQFLYDGKPPSCRAGASSAHVNDSSSWKILGVEGKGPGVQRTDVLEGTHGNAGPFPAATEFDNLGCCGLFVDVEIHFLYAFLGRRSLEVYFVVVSCILHRHPVSLFIKMNEIERVYRGNLLHCGIDNVDLASPCH